MKLGPLGKGHTHPPELVFLFLAQVLGDFQGHQQYLKVCHPLPLLLSLKIFLFSWLQVFVVAPGIFRCGPPRPTQSSGNAPSSPVEDDEQGCTQAVLGEGLAKVSVGNPSQKHRKRCMFRHMSIKAASGSGSETGLLLAAWRRRGAPGGDSYPASPPLSCPDTPS